MRPFNAIRNFPGEFCRMIISVHLKTPQASFNAVLDGNLLQARCQSLKYERRILAVALFLLARMGLLSSSEIPRSSTGSTRTGAIRHTSSIVAAFDVDDPCSPGGQARLVVYGCLIAETQRKVGGAHPD